MKKFVAIYRVPVEAMEEWKKNTSLEEMQRQGKELGEKMMAWSKEHQASFVGEGMPLGKNTRMSGAGAQPLTNDLNYLQVVQAESKEAVVAMFENNPHFAIPTSFVDIMEVPEMKM